MTLEDIMSLHGDPAAMREAIIAYGNEWREAGAAAEREACALVCEARYMGDNNREDMEARRCAAAIRARAQEE